jgi:hypothetical protein
VIYSRVPPSSTIQSINNVTWGGCILFEPLYRLCALSAEQKEALIRAGECFRHTHIPIILYTCAYSYSPGCDGRAAVEVAEAEQSLQTRILCRNIVELQTLDNREDHVLGLRSGTDPVSKRLLRLLSVRWVCVSTLAEPAHPIDPPSTSTYRELWRGLGGQRHHLQRLRGRHPNLLQMTEGPLD